MHYKMPSRLRRPDSANLKPNRLSRRTCSLLFGQSWLQPAPSRRSACVSPLPQTCRLPPNGEILSAAWAHMDWKSGQFHVRPTYKEGQFQKPKTRTSYRRLTLPTFLLNELKVWRLACPISQYDLVFPNLDGQPMSHANLLQRGFYPALRRAGLRRIRFHDLRHTFASLMISNGEDVVRVSRLMGHANAAITLNIYSHMIPREHDPSGDRLASFVFGNKMETMENSDLTSNSDPAKNAVKINDVLPET